MKYSVDQPINDKKDDLLGRKTFSKYLGKAIYEHNQEAGLVIGLYGKWGTGKTSVINMTENVIKKLAKKDKNKPLIIKFAPWSYSDKDNLIGLFFQSLRNKIENPIKAKFYLSDKKKKKIKEATELMGEYAKRFCGITTMLGANPVAASYLKIFAEAIGVSGTIPTWFPDQDLEKAKNKLDKKLKKLNKKIIVVIDDIDRLTNPQIRDIFQLVKQVADFSNIVYVLVMDKEVVCSALEKVHNMDGNEYLEKIVQVPFELPEIRKGSLHNILRDRINKIVNGHVSNEEYYASILRNCVEPYVNTMRDVNRLINIFQFKYEALNKETLPEDLLAITILEVLEPKLYKWIYDNKDFVCGGMEYVLARQGNKALDYYRDKYYGELKDIGINPDIAVDCVATLFPSFAKIIGKYRHIGAPSMKGIKEGMRIANTRKIETYFVFDLDNVKVSRDIVNNCIFEFDKGALYTTIRKINKEGNIAYFLEEIRLLVDDIPYERLELIMSVMLDLHGKFEGEVQELLSTTSAYKFASDLICRIVKRFKTEEERYQVISSAIRKTDKRGLSTIARIINDIELGYGRLAGSAERKDKQIISLEHLKELEKEYIKRIRSIVNLESILSINGFNITFYLWKCLDEKEALNFLKRLFKFEVNKLKFVCSMVSGNGSNESDWKINSEHYNEYISKEEIYKTIQELDKGKLSEFTRLEQEKLASFVLHYQNDGTERINRQMIQKVIDQWGK